MDRGAEQAGMGAFRHQHQMHRQHQPMNCVGGLDPTAQEFHPSASPSTATTPPAFHPHFTIPQIYYPTPPTYSAPPLLPHLGAPSLIQYPHQHHLPHHPPLTPIIIPPQQDLLSTVRTTATTTTHRPAYVSHGPAEALPDTIQTRSLLLSSVPPHANEGIIRMDLEASFGGVRTVDMSRLPGEGVVVVHFFDLRSARKALDAIREQHVRQQGHAWQHLLVGGMNTNSSNWCGAGPGGGVPGTIAGVAVWAQFAPEGCGAGDSITNNGSSWPWNNGSLVVFNLDPSVTSTQLKQAFEQYGAVKETRETPMKPRHRFVEFYDTRDAARALVDLKGKMLFGNPVAIDFSRPGGHGRSYYSRKSTPVSIANYHQQSSHNRAQFPLQLSPAHSIAAASSTALLPRSSSNVSSSSSRSPPPRPLSSSSGGDGVHSSQQQPQKHTELSKKNRHHPNHGSAGSSSSSHAAPAGRSNTRGWKGGRAGRTRPMDARFVITLDEAAVASAATARDTCHGDHNQHEGSSSNSSTSSIGHGSTGTATTAGCSRDPRTTVMIKNIPNKYSQKLLLNMLDNHCIHCNEQIVANHMEGKEPFSSYDFVYLPIDFNNKCNVGYGFVNMTSPEATWKLYKAFHLQPWEVFNSRKICQITYARLQGLDALLEHFRNSKFACDNDEYMPVVFSPSRDGKNHTPPSTIGGRGSSSAASSSSHVMDDVVTKKMLLLRTSDEYCHTTAAVGATSEAGGESTTPGSTVGGASSDGDGHEEDEDEDDGTGV